MELDEQTFKNLVGKDVQLAAVQGDKRLAERVPISRNAYCAEILPDGTHAEKIPCQVREISRRGAGLLVFSQLSGKRGLILWIPDPKGNELAIECGVPRVAPCPGTAQMCVAGLAYVRAYTPIVVPQPEPPAIPVNDKPTAAQEEAARIEAIRKAILD